MNRDDVIQYVAERFGIELEDRNGEYNLDTYEWQAGCYTGNRDPYNDENIWLSVAKIVEIMDDFACDYGLYEDDN